MTLMVALGVPVALAQVAGNRIRAAAADQSGPASPAPADLHTLKGQLEAFQTVLNRSVLESFGQPFSLLQDAQGIYLPGFGVAFHMELNLLPVRLQMPFDIQPPTPEEVRKAREEKVARIRQLRTRLSELLLEHGGEFSAMAGEQNVAVAVHLFNLPSEGRDLPSQLVITVNRQTLDDYRNGRLTAEQFQQAGSVLEF